MATWIEFLTNMRAKVMVEKQDSGWIPHPEEPRLLLYIAYINGETLGATLSQGNRQDYTFFTLSLVSSSARTVSLLFSTLEDAKLAHKMMTNEEKRYAEWEKAQPQAPEERFTIRTLDDVEALLTRLRTLINPMPNIQNTPKLFTGDPPKDKN